MSRIFSNIFLLLVIVSLALTGVFATTLYAFFSTTEMAQGEETLFCGVTAEGSTYRINYVAAHELGLVENVSGKNLFLENCVQCHALKETIVGPPLHNIHTRRSKEWLRQFIRDPEALVKQEDTTAIQLYKEYGFIMPAHDYLSQAEIDSIISYLEYASVTIIY
jgi:cytochrome c551/c552